MEMEEEGELEVMAGVYPEVKRSVVMGIGAAGIWVVEAVVGSCGSVRGRYRQCLWTRENDTCKTRRFVTSCAGRQRVLRSVGTRIETERDKSQGRVLI